MSEYDKALQSDTEEYEQAMKPARKGESSDEAREPRTDDAERNEARRKE